MTVSEYLGELVQAQLEGRKPQNLPSQITVDELVDISNRNHMDYLVLGGLLRVSNLTEEQKKPLKGRVMTSVMRTMCQVSELKEIEKSFENKHVKNQPMKGARMKFIYPSPEMREMSDIDILIDNDCMDAAAEVLIGQGYILHQAIKHHDIYTKAPFMIVEAHRSLYDKTVDQGQYKYFANFSKAELREGCSYTYDFSVEDFYIYMIAHMAKHFYAMGCGIRNLVDIYVYIKKYGNVMRKDYLKQELTKCGIFEFATHMEKLSSIWLDNQKSNSFYNDLFQYMMDSGIYGKDENGIWNKFAEEKMKDKEATISQLKRWYYFPPISYMSEHYPWLENHPFLLPVAWLIRVWRGLFKKKGIHKREMLQEINRTQINTYQCIYQKMGLHFKG